MNSPHSKVEDEAACPRCLVIVYTSKMSVTESDIECSTDSDSDVTEPKARSRPRPRCSQSIRSEANIHDV